MKIAILGHYGNGNLGDEAIIEATLSSIRRHFERPELICFSMNPGDTAERHEVPAFPVRRQALHRGPPARAEPQIVTVPVANRMTLRARLKRVPLLGAVLKLAVRSIDSLKDGVAEVRFLREATKSLNDVDLLIVTGSNQFLDNFGGALGFPYTLLKWALACRLKGIPVVFLSVGAGPLDGTVSKLFVRAAIRLADYVSYRDKASRELVEGTPSTSPVYPDLAHNLDFPRFERPHRSPLTVGLNPMPVFDHRYWCVPDAEQYQSYVVRMAELVDALHAAGYSVFFFGTQTKDYGVIDDVNAALTHCTPPPVYRPESVQDLLRVVQAADVCISTRFHGTVLPLAAHRPVLGVCYHRKSRDVLAEAGQADYAVMIEQFEPEDLLRRLQRLEAAYGHEVRQIQTWMQGAVASLEDQYRLLASRFDIDARSGQGAHGGKDERYHQAMPR